MRLYIIVTVKNIDMKFKEIKNMTISQIWEKFQKPFNFAWKAGIIVIAICTACGLLSELISFICCRASDKVSDIEYISDNVKAEYYTDGTCRLYERYSDKKLSKKLRFVDSCPMTDDSLTSYQSLEGKWGFIDMNSGKIVIPADYEKVWDFNEGLAAVADAAHKVGFIDKTGVLQIPMMDIDWKDGYYSFENGLCVLTHTSSGKKGAIDKKGNWILPMEYDSIDYPYDNGFIKLRSGDLWGMYDMNGNEVFEIKYDGIFYDAGLEGVFILKDGIKQLMTVSGEVIEPFIVDRTYPLRYIIEYYPESESEYITHPYLVDYEIDNYHGVFNTRSGKIVIPAIYDTVEMVSEETIKASLGLENIESVCFNIIGDKIVGI